MSGKPDQSPPSVGRLAGDNRGEARRSLRDCRVGQISRWERTGSKAGNAAMQFESFAGVSDDER